MGAITEFSDDYPLIQHDVCKIVWYSTLSKGEDDRNSDPERPKRLDYRWVDFSVTLKNGDVYHFTAVTPDFIKETMERDDMKSWMEPGCIVLRKINQECIFDAVEKWLS